MRKGKTVGGLCGMSAILLVGLFVTAPVKAQGPFWYHRNNSTEGNGVKISAREPEEIRGGGGEAVLDFKLLGSEIEISANQVQVKGIIYNNGLQGQAKLALTYNQPTLVKPANSHCAVTINSKNVVKIFGHQAWTWDGTEAQLKEQPQTNQKPDWIFTGQELQQGATGLPKGVSIFIMTLSSSGGTCLLASTTNVEGSMAMAVAPEKVGEFSKKQIIEALANGVGQHFWNGKENVGVKPELVFAGAAAKLKQLTETTTFGRQGGAAQEVGLLGD